LAGSFEEKFARQMLQKQTPAFPAPGPFFSRCASLAKIDCFFAHRVVAPFALSLMAVLLMFSF
jgi:hypothetical protein